MSKYGVFFGQNAVDQNAPDYKGWAGLLAGCVNDAADLARMFSLFGYETRAVLSGWNVGKVAPVPANEWVLTLGCTRRAWREAHAELQTQAKPGDTVIVGNSGHGYQYDTTMQFNGGEGMCFADGLLRDTEQHAMMRLWPEGVTVVYILDECFAGGMDKEFQPHWPKAMPDKLKPGEDFERGEMRSEDVAARVIQLCASRRDETSADGALNGAFTGTLLSVLAQSRHNASPVTWRQMVDVCGVLMAPVFRQHPVLNVIGAGAEVADAAP